MDRAKRKAGAALTASTHDPSLDDLNPRQRLFAREYMASGNGTAAARKAGYGAPHVAASRLLRNAKVQAVLHREFERLGLTREQILARLSEMALASIGDFLDARGRIRVAAVRKRGWLVKRFKPPGPKSGGEIELHDALAALVLIGKHLGLFNGEANREPTQIAIQVNVANEDLPS